MNSAAFLNNSKEKHFMCLFHVEHHFFLPDNTWLFEIHFSALALDLRCTHSSVSLVFLLLLELQHVLIVTNDFLGLTTTTLPHTSPFLHKSENMSILIFDSWFYDRFRFDWWYIKERGLKSCSILVGIRTSGFFSPFEIPAWRLERVWDAHLDSSLSKH